MPEFEYYFYFFKLSYQKNMDKIIKKVQINSFEKNGFNLKEFSKALNQFLGLILTPDPKGNPFREPKLNNF